MSNFFEQFTDAHAHLPEDFARVDVPAEAKILLNSVTPADFDAVANLACRFPKNVSPAFGVHPWFAEQWNADAEQKLRRFLTEIPDASVGEIGLDRCRGNAELQEAVFRRQLEIAAEFSVPVSIHCVRAFGKTETILRELRFTQPFLLHAYSGSPEQAKVFAKLGGVFSAPRKRLPPECICVTESDRPL